MSSDKPGKVSQRDSSDDKSLAPKSDLARLSKAGTFTPSPRVEIDFSQLAFRLASSRPHFSGADMSAVKSIVGRAQPGSAEEAAIALVIIHRSNTPSTNGAFNESDLYPKAAADPGGRQELSKTSLEELSSSLHFDFARGLSNNPLLQSQKVQMMIIESLKSQPSSNQFQVDVYEVIKNQAGLWASLGTQIGLDSSQTSPRPNPASLPDAHGIKPALRFGGSDFRSDDNILQDAQALLDRGLFKKSVATLSRLKETSPLFAAAQEKIRESSNRAVQKLRRKAAKAFQSAIPVADLAAKETYLKKAKMHLEAALSNFPKAEQLATVRENLTVINRDLLRIANRLTKNPSKNQ